MYSSSYYYSKTFLDPLPEGSPLQEAEKFVDHAHVIESSLFNHSCFGIPLALLILGLPFIPGSALGIGLGEAGALALLIGLAIHHCKSYRAALEGTTNDKFLDALSTVWHHVENRSRAHTKHAEVLEWALNNAIFDLPPEKVTQLLDHLVRAYYKAPPEGKEFALKVLTFLARSPEDWDEKLFGPEPHAEAVKDYLCKLGEEVLKERSAQALLTAGDELSASDAVTKQQIENYLIALKEEGGQAPKENEPSLNLHLAYRDANHSLNDKYAFPLALLIIGLALISTATEAHVLGVSVQTLLYGNVHAISCLALVPFILLATYLGAKNYHSEAEKLASGADTDLLFRLCMKHGEEKKRLGIDLNAQEKRRLLRLIDQHLFVAPGITSEEQAKVLCYFFGRNYGEEIQLYGEDCSPALKQFLETVPPPPPAEEAVAADYSDLMSVDSSTARTTVIK